MDNGRLSGAGFARGFLGQQADQRTLRVSRFGTGRQQEFCGWFSSRKRYQIINIAIRAVSLGRSCLRGYLHPSVPYVQYGQARAENRPYSGGQTGHSYCDSRSASFSLNSFSCCREMPEDDKFQILCRTSNLYSSSLKSTPKRCR